MITTFAQSPYNDDYQSPDVNFNEKTAVDKNYLRILFKPSRSVQVRELNQIQSILQNQIDKFGSSVFKEGTPIIDGLSSYNNALFYVDILVENTALINTDSGVVVTEYLEQIINIENRVEGQSVAGGLTAEVIGYEQGTVTNQYRFFIKYKSSLQVDGENVIQYTPKVNNVGDNIITSADINNTAGDSVIVNGDTIGSVAGIGYASSFTVDAGVFYVKGCFVVTEKITSFFTKPSKDYTIDGDFAFFVKENFVTYSEDQSLLDNATVTPNYNAPGADRYSIALTPVFLSQNLSTNDNTFIASHNNVYDKSNLSVNSSYMKLISIIDGKNVYPARTELSGLGRILAKRTYEESGNYIVKPFVAPVSEYLNDEVGNNGIYTSQEIVDADLGDSITTLTEGEEYGEKRIVIEVEPAIAYVEGFRVELRDKLKVPVEKARTTKEIDVGITASLGAYVEGTLSSGLPDIHDNSVVYNIDGGPLTCRIRHIQQMTSTVYRLYLFDLADEIPDAASITTTNFQFDYTGGLVDASNTQSVYSLPYDTVGGITNIEVTEVLSFDSTVDSGGAYCDIQVPVSLVNANFESTNLFDYIVVDETTHAQYAVTNVAIQSSTVVRLTLTSPVANNDVRVLGPVENILPLPENKTINSTSEDVTFGPGDSVTLAQSDVFEITDIQFDAGSGFESILNSQKPFRYIKLDKGQRDGIYKLSSVKRLGLADGVYKVFYKYFAHSGDGNYFSVESYDNEGFKENLVYKENRLTDTLDFRSKENDPVTIIKPGSLIEAKVTYYLPQYNQLVVDTLGEVYFVEGIPEIEPIIPETPDGTMAIYNMYFPAYTFNADDIQKTYLDNKVYTMSDIAKLDKRVSNVENLLSLSLLEKAAAEKTFVNDSDGSIRFKNGMIIDTFNGHSIGDVFDPSYKVSVDGDAGILRPLFQQKNLPLSIDAPTTDVLSLPYSETELINQEFASGVESVAPYDVVSWNGTIQLSPSSDDWFETSVRPDVLVNLDGNFDGVKFITDENDSFGTKWNCWRKNWLGEDSKSVINKTERPKTVTTADGKTRVSSSTTSIGTTPADSIREDLRKTFDVKTIEKGLGNRVVDLNFIPYIRSRKVYFKAKMLKPNTKLYAFFDGIEVTSYCTTSTFVNYRDAEIEYFTDNADPVPLLEQEDLITDADGNIEGYFIIPNHDALRFKTGERVFRLVDSSTNDKNNTYTYCEMTYSAIGLLQTKETTILSTREIVKNRERLETERNVIKEGLSDSLTYRDPIAQSFVIGNEDNGVFLTSVDFYFYSKDENSSVSTYIVSLENGVPTQNIIPFTRVTKLPGEINVDTTNGTTATNFSFDAPVYLEPGIEYALVLISNSPNYKVWYGEIGGQDVATSNRISKNPYGGVLFKSANASTWTAEQTKDLKFKLNRANFSSTSLQYTLKPKFQTGESVNASVFEIAQQSIKVPGTEISYELNIGNIAGPTAHSIEPGESLNLETEKTIDNSGNSTNGASVTLTLSGTSKVSPMVDLDRLSLLCIENEINNDVTDETLFSHGNAEAKYITREIKLNDPADRVDVYFKANLPSQEASIKTYYRSKSGDDTDITDNAWTLLENADVIEEPIINADGTYSDVHYRFNPTELFSSFQIKIVLLSSNPAKVATVKEFRSIATI